MRAFIALTLITLLVLSACSSGSKHRNRAAKRMQREPVRTEQPLTARKQLVSKSKKISRTPGSQGTTGMLLPTRTHPADGAQMVLVDSPVKQAGAVNPTRGTLRTNRSANLSSEGGTFYIDRTEVRVEQYKKFDPEYDETPFTGKAGCPACPAMGIDWSGADRYCRSMGKRLPTEAEWETAARGPTHYRLPWGDRFDPRHANLVGDADGFLSVAPVGSFPVGAGPYGALDMIGNVWEWVGMPHSPLPADPAPEKDKTRRIAKGGGWTSPPQLASITHRNVADGTMKNPTFGFRCVKSVK